MRAIHAVIAAMLLIASHAFAQTPARPLLRVGATPRPSAPAASSWTFDASANFYVLPDERDYLQPTFAADRGRLHMEARYNYEDLETGSLWLGANFSGGGTVEWEITPMIGAAFGTTRGVAPGYTGSLAWRKLELYSEGEHFLDASDSSGNFFYSWSEASVAPTEWLRVGLAAQRTRAYESDREFQRGILAGYSHQRVSITTYVFNPDDSTPIVVLGMGVTF